MAVNVITNIFIKNKEEFKMEEKVLETTIDEGVAVDTAVDQMPAVEAPVKGNTAKKVIGGLAIAGALVGGFFGVRALYKKAKAKKAAKTDAKVEVVEASETEKK